MPKQFDTHETSLKISLNVVLVFLPLLLILQMFGALLDCLSLWTFSKFLKEF